MFIKQGDDQPITSIIKSKKDIEDAKETLKKVFEKIEEQKADAEDKKEESK